AEPIPPVLLPPEVITDGSAPLEWEPPLAPRPDEPESASGEVAGAAVGTAVVEDAGTDQPVPIEDESAVEDSPAAAPDVSAERDNSHESEAISFDGSEAVPDPDNPADDQSTTDRFEALRDELRSTGTVEPVADSPTKDDEDPGDPSDEPPGEWGLPQR
ncbi:MAG: hypothetical protein ACR2N2_03770, partial [Acidimicrobiia bacterium]